MMGIDLDEQIAQAAPTIIAQIDKSLADIPLAKGESKGLVIVPDGHGSYYLVKTVFDAEAGKHMQQKGVQKVDQLIQTIIHSLTD